MALVTSYNGWTASQNPADFGGLDNRDVPGAPGVKLAPGVRAGDAATVLFYVAAQLHKRVEPGVMPGCWGYSYRASKNSPVLLSTHSSGTGFDWNAPLHPNGRSGTFSKAQVAEIGKIIQEVDSVVYWGGGGWGGGTVDEMHFELSAAPAKVATIAARLLAPAATPDPTTIPEDFMAALTPDEQRRMLANLDKVAWLADQMKQQTDRLPDEDAQTDQLVWGILDPTQGLRVQVAAMRAALDAQTEAIKALAARVPPA